MLDSVDLEDRLSQFGADGEEVCQKQSLKQLGVMLSAYRGKCRISRSFNTVWNPHAYGATPDTVRLAVFRATAS